MPRKCCVHKCKGNYTSSDQKVSVYTFPKDLAEQQRWLDALPKFIRTVTPNIGICSKHWPSDALFVKVKKHLRPAEPPSIFSGFSHLMFRQTAATTSRHTTVRKVLADSRNHIPDELEEFERQDRLSSAWSDFVLSLKTHSIIIDNDLFVVLDSSSSR